MIYVEVWIIQSFQNPFYTAKGVGNKIRHGFTMSANTQRNKNIIITSKPCFSVIITCLLRFVFAGKVCHYTCNKLFDDYLYSFQVYFIARIIECNFYVTFMIINCIKLYHYHDVIMSAIASQITSLAIVYSTVYPGADQRKQKGLRHWPLCGEFTGDRWKVSAPMVIYCPFDLWNKLRRNF